MRFRTRAYRQTIRGTLLHYIVLLMLVVTLSSCESRREQGASAQRDEADVASATPEAVASGGCFGQPLCDGRHPLVKNVRLLQDSGARPAFSPDGTQIAFDRKNEDGFYDVYVTNLEGSDVRGLTENNAIIDQRNNGNATFDPSGQFIVFISEELEHFGPRMTWLGDPGLGLFSNLWAISVDGSQAWKLTNIPIKKNIWDKTPSMGVVNPHFSPDGTTLYWTERYGEGGNHNWGRWRIKAATFSAANGQPTLSDERIVFTPSKGNYVTLVAFLNSEEAILAGNLDGQHEYGMDEYVLNLQSGALRNLQNSPENWEEDACVSPQGLVVYMTNTDSKYRLNFDDPDWPRQPKQREWWLFNPATNQHERLTFFNDPGAPEYAGPRIITAACNFSPDGRYLAGILGVDTTPDTNKTNFALKIVLLELESPSEN